MSVNKMKNHGIILRLNTIFKSIWNWVFLLSVQYDFSFRSSFYLPFGKADDTPSPSLSRTRSSSLRLHPWRLGSGASSTFAQLGYYIHKKDKKPDKFFLKISGKILFINNPYYISPDMKTSADPEYLMSS